MDDKQKDLTARSLTLLDEKGNPRIFLSADSHQGIPKITMLDKHGQERIAITIEDHPMICILNRDGSTATGMVGTLKSGGSMAVNDSDGKRAIELAADGSFGRCVLVFGENGASTASLP